MAKSIATDATDSLKKVVIERFGSRIILSFMILMLFKSWPLLIYLFVTKDEPFTRIDCVRDELIKIEHFDIIMRLIIAIIYGLSWDAVSTIVKNTSSLFKEIVANVFLKSQLKLTRRTAELQKLEDVIHDKEASIYALQMTINDLNDRLLKYEPKTENQPF